MCWTFAKAPVALILHTGLTFQINCCTSNRREIKQGVLIKRWVFMCVCVCRTAAVILSGRTTHNSDKPWTEENNYIRINRGAAKRWARKQNLTTCSNERHRDQRTTDRQTDGRTDVPDALPEALAAASHTGTCLSGIYTVSKTAHFLIMYPHTTVGGECRVFGSPVRPSLC